MFDKIITFLFKTASDLEKLNAKAQVEYQKYSNKQVKKAAIVAGSIGLAVGFLLKACVF